MTQQLFSNLTQQPTQSTARGHVFRWMMLAIFLCLGLACWKLGVSSDSLSDLLHNTGLDPTSPSAQVTFFFVALVLVSLVLPKTAVSISAGFLFGSLTGGILITLISVTAAIGNYAIGRWLLSQSIARRYAQHDQLSAPLWAIAMHDLAAEAGYGFHLLFRFATIPSMLLNYFMGAVRAKVAPFMFAALVGVLPQLLWVHGASIASVNSEDISVNHVITSSISILAAIIIAIVIPRQVMQRIKRIQNERAQQNEREQSVGYNEAHEHSLSLPKEPDA